MDFTLYWRHFTKYELLCTLYMYMQVYDKLHPPHYNIRYEVWNAQSYAAAGLKEMSSIFADQYIAPSYMSPNAGVGGGGSGVSANEYSQWPRNPPHFGSNRRALLVSHDIDDISLWPPELRTRSPNKLWRSNSIFNLCYPGTQLKCSYYWWLQKRSGIKALNLKYNEYRELRGKTRKHRKM